MAHNTCLEKRGLLDTNTPYTFEHKKNNSTHACYTIAQNEQWKLCAKIYFKCFINYFKIL